MNCFIDFEFVEGSIKKKLFGITYFQTPHIVQPISVAIRKGKEKVFYRIYNDFDLDFAWDNVWIRENVLAKIHDHVYKEHSSLIEHTDMYGNDPENLENFNKKTMKRLLKLYGKPSVEIADDMCMYLTGCSRRYLDSNYNKSKEFNISLIGYYSEYDSVMLGATFGKKINVPRHIPWHIKDVDVEIERDIVKYYHRLIPNSRRSEEGITFNKIQSLKKLVKKEIESRYKIPQGTHHAIDDVDYIASLYTSYMNYKSTAQLEKFLFNAF